jgi:hypothetical protein
MRLKRNECKSDDAVSLNPRVDKKHRHVPVDCSAGRSGYIGPFA